MNILSGRAKNEERTADPSGLGPRDDKTESKTPLDKRGLNGFSRIRKEQFGKRIVLLVAAFCEFAVLYGVTVNATVRACVVVTNVFGLIAAAGLAHALKLGVDGAPGNAGEAPGIDAVSFRNVGIGEPRL